MESTFGARFCGDCGRYLPTTLDDIPMIRGALGALSRLRPHTAAVCSDEAFLRQYLASPPSQRAPFQPAQHTYANFEEARAAAAARPAADGWKAVQYEVCIAQNATPAVFQQLGAMLQRFDMYRPAHIRMTTQWDAEQRGTARVGDAFVERINLLPVVPLLDVLVVDVVHSVYDEEVRKGLTVVSDSLWHEEVGEHVCWLVWQRNQDVVLQTLSSSRMQSHVLFPASLYARYLQTYYVRNSVERLREFAARLSQ
eukprot:m.99030 g.99030  ORF g.99030 m.99030 type:complete len:254 (-) comp18588_c0_seq3:145-906(-)